MATYETSRAAPFGAITVFRMVQAVGTAATALQAWNSARVTRNAGPWFDSAANLWAVQARYETVYAWDALIEYRHLRTDYDGGTREGWLVGVDRHLNNNLRLGIGYNFTDFSDDLTDFDYDHRGWFLNLVGTY